MKRLLNISLISISAFLLTSFSTTSSSTSSYDIAEVYEEVRVDSGAKTIDSYGNVKDVKKLLLPTKLETGKYTVKITKIDSDFYQICDTKLYIETKYCYKYATREEVVINITSNYGYTKGEVVFF